MRAQIASIWYAIRYSYWFVPSLMTLAAIALSIATFAVDAAVGDAWPQGLRQFGLYTPDGARTLLSTIAGSMITVAGVTFSITIAAVVFATGQLGPRLLANFMGDTGNQITLGTFIATFVYGLLVLRTVQGGDDGDNFVPHLGVLVAILLALASLGVLISFIHHVPRSISAAQVVADLGEDLNRRMERLFPSRLGEAPDRDGDLGQVAPTLPDDAGVPVVATGDGYVTQIDAASLLAKAAERDCVLRLRVRPGDFVSRGTLLATVHGAAPDSDLCNAVATAIALENERTNQQDVLFVVQQMVEIAIRAMSPGINDPFTAIGCLDWLGSGICNLGQRTLPSRFRHDGDGKLRVIVPDLGFDNIAAAMFDQLRPYVAGDRNVALHMMTTLQRAVETVHHPPYRAALLEQAAALNDGAQAALPLRRDRIALQAAHARLFDMVGGADDT